MPQSDPFKIPNIRLFIAFRICFNSRFYYPVFAILFLDFGLTLDQFALLNMIWALSIVLLEVPSGALADTIGRRNLLVGAAILMVLEIAILCFAPRTNPTILFCAFLANRILSGAAEASASGADEALAYDSLKSCGMAEHWGKILEKQMRMTSISFFIVMIAGAAVYDPSFVQWIVDRLGENIQITQDMTIRFPLYLTLGMAIMTLVIAIRMKEVDISNNNGRTRQRSIVETVVSSFRTTFETGAWIIRTPFALTVIVAGMLFDHTARMLVTLSSQYYRLIELPDASFGLIGAGMSLSGLFIPLIAGKMVQKYSFFKNILILTGLMITGLWGMTHFWPVLGLAPVFIIFCVMTMVSFFMSHYLNDITASEQRATVLSFKGLTFNLAYGAIGLMYSMLSAYLRSGRDSEFDDFIGLNTEDLVFMESINWFPWYFLALIAMFGIMRKNGFKP